ncbi:Allantoinase [Trichinella spiralis]|uniref:Allantoinase n=1 Tax=Trichinella spiralis TaxID=6334 RepID=A0ABR3K4T1_TRISP
MVRSSVCSRKLHTNFNDSTTVCLSCLVTLLHFLICNVVLATCEITDCGVQSGETSFFLQHIVFFVGLQDGMMFKDCIGTIMPSAPNFTYSDTVITSRYCFTNWESVPMVVLGALYLQNVHVQGIHIRRMSSPFGREEANAVNIPFNFAIIKLASHVQFSFAAIPRFFERFWSSFQTEDYLSVGKLRAVDPPVEAFSSQAHLCGIYHATCTGIVRFGN